MKKVLITGANSYIGMYFDNFMKQFCDSYQVDTIDMISESWKQFDFSNYDTVYHVAGLAHSTPTEDQRDLYYKVNTQLAYDTALKAKNEGVKQFIFMSSIIVYGSGTIGKERIIDENTPLTPDNFYGDSKKQAEIKLTTLRDETFKLAIVRPPMIYGPNSKGNYKLLSKFAKVSPIFPNIENKRSVLFVGNLVNFIKLLIDNEDDGIFLPQNSEYMCTSEFVKEIARVKNKSIHLTKIFNPMIGLLNKNIYINKLFGNMEIDKQLSDYSCKYAIYTMTESIKETELN